MSIILVVDDEPAVRTLVAGILETAGYIVVLASNGLEGISLFRSYPNRFDMIVTDLKMPVMDGHRLIKLIHDTSPTAKIVCMSGYTDKPIPLDVTLLQKPFRPGDLLSCVDELLQRGSEKPEFNT